MAWDRAAAAFGLTPSILAVRMLTLLSGVIAWGRMAAYALPMNGGNMSNARLRISLTTLLFVSLACSGTSNLFEQAAPPQSGPILSMIPASAVDERGQAVDSKFSFDPSTAEIAVVAQVGNLDAPAPMTITWYQVTDQGDLQLFVDTVQVSALERAWSIGKNPGTLTPGPYKIKAALNGETQELLVSVNQPAAGAMQSQSQAAASGTASAPSQPLVAGGSGKAPIGSSAVGQAASSPSGDSMGCQLVVIAAGADESQIETAAIDVEILPLVNDCFFPSRLELDASVNDGPITRKFQDVPAATKSSQPILNPQPLDPCSIKGGSNLPGDRVKVSGQLLSNQITGTIYQLSDHFEVTLAPDDRRPGVVVQLDPDPKANKRLKPGDKVKVTVTGEDANRPNGPWESGMASIEVKGPEGDIAPPWINPRSKLQQACLKSEDRTHTYEPPAFVVTAATPAKFTLCAIAKDYAANVNNDEANCGTFYTADHWSGAMQSNNLTVYENTGQGTVTTGGTWNTTFDLAVDGQGNITGDGESKLTSGCKPFPWQVDPQATGITFGVTGTAYKDHLELHLNFIGLEGGTVNCGFGQGFFSGQAIEVPLTSQTTAEGTANESTDVGASNHFSSQGTIELKCDNCAPGVGLKDSPMPMALRMLREPLTSLLAGTAYFNVP